MIQLITLGISKDEVKMSELAAKEKKARFETAN